MRAITIDMVGSALKKLVQTRVRNPTKMPGKSKTDIEAVKEYVKYFGLKISPKPGSEPIIGTKSADWYKVFDSWKQAREFFHRARTDRWDFGQSYPWDFGQSYPRDATKKNPLPKPRPKTLPVVGPTRGVNPTPKRQSKQLIVYRVEHSTNPNHGWHEWGTYMYPEMAEAVARRVAAEKPTWHVRVDKSAVIVEGVR
jgi:hypothetical protein